MGVRLRLVHSAEVNYTEYNGGKGTDKDLERLRTKGDGFMDSVHTWRTQYGADLVNLFTFCHDYGGLGYMLATEKGNEALGFSISRVQQAWFTCTTLHEFGHNWGLHHSKSQKTAPGGPGGIYSYAAGGWRWIGGEDNEPYGSVMAYSEGLYTIVPYISNPRDQLSRGGSHRTSGQRRQCEDDQTDQVGHCRLSPSKIIRSAPPVKGGAYLYG